MDSVLDHGAKRAIRIGCQANAWERAVRFGEPLHYTGEHGLHIVDVCLSALESAKLGRPVDVSTTFEVAPPLVT